MNIFIDSNAFLRFFLRDNEIQAQKVLSLFKKAQTQSVTIYTSDMVIAEVVWVLTSLYKEPKENILNYLKQLLSLPSLQIENKKRIEKTLYLFTSHSIDFIDAYNAAFVIQKDESLIFSFDHDFDAVKEVKRIESTSN